MAHKRVLTIQDYSSMGRCSLTTALPIISSCLVECVGLPSCVLSNHTQFKKWELCDLTSYMVPFVNMWDNYNHHFDAIYTGYLLDSQIDNTAKIIKKLKDNNTLIVIDPAMADNGVLYPGFTKEHIKKVKELISLGDIIIPNISELAFLTDNNIKDNYSPDEISSMLSSLSSNNQKKIILTGIKEEKYNMTYLYDKKITTFKNKNLGGKYHGSGDLFASIIVGSYLQTNNLNKSIKLAMKTTYKSIKYTIKENLDGVIYGLNFEQAIPYLSRKLKRYSKI